MSKYSKNKPSEYYIYRIYDSSGNPVNEDSHHNLVNARSKSFNRSGSIRTTLDHRVGDELLGLAENGYRSICFHVNGRVAELCKFENSSKVVLEVFENVDVNYIANKVLSKPFNKIY